uniref:Uncharacterized protein n=1 Tax=Arundo donax TaxID=35708 RepID=A0A0A8ZWK3_ARUDO
MLCLRPTWPSLDKALQCIFYLPMQCLVSTFPSCILIHMKQYFPISLLFQLLMKNG